MPRFNLKTYKINSYKSLKIIHNFFVELIIYLTIQQPPKPAIFIFEFYLAPKSFKLLFSFIKLFLSFILFFIVLFFFNLKNSISILIIILKQLIANRFYFFLMIIFTILHLRLACFFFILLKLYLWISFLFIIFHNVVLNDQQPLYLRLGYVLKVYYLLLFI